MQKWYAALRDGSFLPVTGSPAEGLAGIAVKMALWQHHNWDQAKGFDAEDVAVASAYTAIVKLTGADLAAEVERW
jgi:hypothetical protein